MSPLATAALSLDDQFAIVAKCHSSHFVRFDERRQKKVRKLLTSWLSIKQHC
jgi:hypothetical protein